MAHHRPEWAGQVALHHGSLDKAVREWVEDGVTGFLVRDLEGACAASRSASTGWRPGTACWRMLDRAVHP